MWSGVRDLSNFTGQLLPLFGGHLRGTDLSVHSFPKLPSARLPGSASGYAATQAQVVKHHKVPFWALHLSDLGLYSPAHKP